MLQKKLVQIISAMAVAGLLGMIAVYLVCGKIDGDFVGFCAIFSPGQPAPENVPHSLAAMDGLRNKILAGGVAGVLFGLVAPVLSLRPSQRLESK
mgnify:CR=1 FL=1